MMSIVYIDEPAHSNKERRKLKQVVSHTEENALILRQNNFTCFCSFLVYILDKKKKSITFTFQKLFFFLKKQMGKQSNGS